MGLSGSLTRLKPQIISNVGDIAAIEIPPALDDFSSAVAVIVNIDFIKMPGLRCVFGQHFFTLLAMKMLLPILLVLPVHTAGQFHIWWVRNHGMPLLPTMSPLSSGRLKVARTVVVSKVMADYYSIMFAIVYLLYP